MKARALEASRLPTATTEPEEKAGTSAANLPAIFPAPRIPQRSGGASCGSGTTSAGSEATPEAARASTNSAGSGGRSSVVRVPGGASLRAMSPRVCGRPVGWDGKREWRNW